MTDPEMHRRQVKAQQLPVFSVGEGLYLVGSEEGKIAYKVNVNGTIYCPCADFTRNSKSNPDFKCKHILAVLESQPDGIQSAEAIEKRKPKLDDRFVANLHGKDFVLYSGLLDLGHQRGLAKLEVELVQHPTKENGMEAVCKAVAMTRTGEIFVDIGDANPSNTNRAIAAHVIRMASTRAKARVLRDMNNIGMTALEELGDIEDVVGNGPDRPAVGRKLGSGSKPRETPPRAPARQTGRQDAPPATTQAASSNKEQGKQPSEQKAVSTKNTPPPVAKVATNSQKPAPHATIRMSEAQKRAIASLSRRRGIAEADLDGMAIEAFGVALDSLSPSDAAAFIRQLQQSA
ncbi:hypothetical protein [Solidesulfovibrio sp. C21]|uniref:hypothetical protein n=1 Tax=Solidesulfovibrio sp. C21 TaxID=3398613 RepID=UPI0039FD2261